MSEMTISSFRTLLLLTICISPSMFAQGRVKKKIVEYGWDVPYPDFVRDNIREMEKQPFDGIIFRTKGFDHVFDVRPWQADELRPQLDTLAEIEWDRFANNFLTLYAANKRGMNWFNDVPWTSHDGIPVGVDEPPDTNRILERPGNNILRDITPSATGPQAWALQACFLWRG